MRKREINESYLSKKKLQSQSREFIFKKNLFTGRQEAVGYLIVSMCFCEPIMSEKSKDNMLNMLLLIREMFYHLKK